MTRQQVIEQLSNFSGKWTHLPLHKLQREMQMRGLLEYDDPEPEYNGYGSKAGDETELMVMLSGMVGGQQLHLDTE